MSRSGGGRRLGACHPDRLEEIAHLCSRLTKQITLPLLLGARENWPPCDRFCIDGEITGGQFREHGNLMFGHAEYENAFADGDDLDRLLRRQEQPFPDPEAVISPAGGASACAAGACVPSKVAASRVLRMVREAELQLTVECRAGFMIAAG